MRMAVIVLLGLASAACGAKPAATILAPNEDAMNGCPGIDTARI